MCRHSGVWGLGSGVWGRVCRHSGVWVMGLALIMLLAVDMEQEEKSPYVERIDMSRVGWGVDPFETGWREPCWIRLLCLPGTSAYLQLHDSHPTLWLNSNHFLISLKVSVGQEFPRVQEQTLTQEFLCQWFTYCTECSGEIGMGWGQAGKVKEETEAEFCREVTSAGSAGNSECCFCLSYPSRQWGETRAFPLWLCLFFASLGVGGLWCEESQRPNSGLLCFSGEVLERKKARHEHTDFRQGVGAGCSGTESTMVLGCVLCCKEQA